MADDLDKILEEKFTNALRPGYGWFDEYFMMKTFPEYRDEIKNFEVRDDDVWVSSFPKTGTTWTQEMVWLIANDLDYEGAKTILPARFPFIDMNCALDFRNYKKSHPEFECEDAFVDPVKCFNKMKTRRFIKTHLPWKYLPLQIQNQSKNPKIIHVLRNPKDTCISYYHHSKAIEGGSTSLDEFFKLFIAGKALYGPYWENILSFWEKRHLPNLLIIRYEDMISDLPSVIKKVASFLDKEIPDGEMDKLVKHLSFEEMKNNKAVNFEPLVEVLKVCLADTYTADGIFMRSGKTGSYKAQMTQEMVDIMDKWTEQNSAGTGLSF